MLFAKKKEMVDIRDLPRNVSTGKAFVAKDGYGFVDLTKKRMLPSEERKLKLAAKQTTSTNPSTVFQEQKPVSSFNFFDTPTTSSFSSPASTSSTSSDTDDMLRKISTQISDLDSKVYKIEQRIELLERKAGVSSSDSSTSSSGFTW